MDLLRKIQELDSCYNMKLSSLQVDRKYPIIFAERISNRFGPAIALAIRDTPDRILSLHAPKIFSAFSNQDIDDINSAKVTLNLVYNGQYVNKCAFKVTIENVWLRIKLTIIFLINSILFFSLLLQLLQI
jgi:hypothetical protein